MPVIRRKLPGTNKTRYRAIKVAWEKNGSAGANTVLTNATINRLNAIYPAMRTANELINQKQALSVQSTATKAAAVSICSLYTRHFLITIIMAVERGEMPKAVLSLYGLDVSSPTLPYLGTDEAVIIAAEKLVSGEAARIAAGGTALPMPTAAQVNDKAITAQKAINERSKAADELDNAQEDLSKQIAEIDGVIKKVWDEAETFYNEEEPESRRANCRQWGVVYVSDTRIEITVQALQVKDGNAAPVDTATLTLVETDESATAGKDGGIGLKTGFAGTATLLLAASGFVSQTFTREIDSSSDINLGEITMQPEP